jgi:hypothetical protein
MRHLGHHAPDRLSVNARHYLVQALESQALNDQLVFGRSPDAAADVLNPQSGSGSLFSIRIFCHNLPVPQPDLKFLDLFTAQFRDIRRHPKAEKPVKGRLHDVVRVGAAQ